MHNLEIRSLKQEIVYICNQLAISLSEGNTNHVGRDCWNAFLGLINSSIRTYINRINEKYIQGNFVFIIFIFHILYHIVSLCKYIYIHTVKIHVHVKLYVKIYVNIQIIILNISSSAALYDHDINRKKQEMMDYLPK